jgi:hypothetical protein
MKEARAVVSNRFTITKLQKYLVSSYCKLWQVKMACFT